MYPAAFDYAKPGSVQEAVSLLAANPDAKILNGGHSLLPAMKLRLAQPSMLVDISGIAELKNVSVNGGATIGAAATYDDLLKNSSLQAHTALYEAMGKVGDVQVRNRGTVGGSAAHADPASDIPAALLALGAQLVAVGPNGSRTIAADDFFVDILTTALEPDEVLTQIKVPASGAKSAYEKFAHPASGYAVCGVAVALNRDGSGTVTSARIAVTGSVYKATRCAAAEAAIVGTKATAADIEAAAAKAADGLDLAGDHYASAEYRAHLTTVMAKRALTRAAG
jgi:carbon-monoxide dehydrogenase medium subunit